MARNTIQIPIIKSSNNNIRADIYQKWQNQGSTLLDYDELNVGPVTNKLYCARVVNGAKSLYGMGLAWDGSLVPKDKKIISARLYLYTLQKHNRAIYYRYADFAEGSSIPSYSPADGSKSGGIGLGWDYIDIGELKGNSIVVYGALEWWRNDSGSIIEYFGEVWELYSHRNANYKPYLEIVYDDIPPDAPTSLYPSGITLSTRDEIKFSWLHNSKENLQQKGFTLQYSTNSGSTWTTVSQTTPNQFYDMPANTLPVNGTVMWRVKTLDSNDSESEYSAASFTLGVVAQKAPVPVSPISQYLDENKPIRFEWSFVGGSGSEYQSKFDLQYSINSGSTWTTKTVTTPNTFLELPANTFSGGNILWRVRTYNNWNEVSPYSENKSFTVIGSPPIPLISNVSNSARPLISWQSTNQHIYELQILKNNEVIFETGSIPSTSDRSFKLEKYLEDGNYFVKLRIANEYNLYSTWAEKSFTISTAKPQKPIIDVFSGEYSVTIKTSNTSAKTLVYRDNILIGEVINNNFVDYTGENNKEYQYFIRTIDSNDNFSDSDIKLAKCKFRGNTLALASNSSEFIKLRFGYNSRPKKSNSFGVNGNLVYYDGRKHPVVEYSEFNNRVKSLTFFVKTIEEVEAIEKMIEARQTFLYRNNNGRNIYGTIFDISYEEDIFGYEIGFTITKTEV